MKSEKLIEKIKNLDENALDQDDIAQIDFEVKSEEVDMAELGDKYNDFTNEDEIL